MIAWLVVAGIAFIAVGGTFAGLSIATDGRRDGLARWAGVAVTLLSMCVVVLVAELAYTIAKGAS